MLESRAEFSTQGNAEVYLIGRFIVPSISHTFLLYAVQDPLVLAEAASMQTSPPPSSPDIARPPRRMRSMLQQRRRAPGRRGFEDETAGPRLEAALPEPSLAAKVFRPSGYKAGVRPTLHTCKQALQALYLARARASVLQTSCELAPDSIQNECHL